VAETPPTRLTRRELAARYRHIESQLLADRQYVFVGVFAEGTMGVHADPCLIADCATISSSDLQSGEVKMSRNGRSIFSHQHHHMSVPLGAQLICISALLAPHDSSAPDDEMRPMVYTLRFVGGYLCSQ
jgi:hypothetical protein